MTTNNCKVQRISPVFKYPYIYLFCERLFCFSGRLNATFDENGDLIKFSGQPILLDSTIPQDDDVLQLLDVYRPAVDEVNKEQVGTLQVTLDNNKCRTEECNYGNLIADANVLYKASISPETWTNAPIGLMQGGGIRMSVMPGVNQGVTRGEILGTLPFGHQIVTLTLKGSALVKTLELGIRGNGETSRGEFLQVSGLQIVYDRSKPAMSRVVSVKTRCGSCNIPIYEDIDLDKSYTIITTDFLSNGNDGHYILKEQGWNKQQQDLGDVDILTWYFNTYSPVYAEVQGRIKFVNIEDHKESSAVTIMCTNISFVIVIMVIKYFL